MVWVNAVQGLSEKMINLFIFWGRKNERKRELAAQKQMILLFARGADPIGVGTHFRIVDPG